MKIPATIKTWGMCILMGDRELKGDQPGSLNHFNKVLMNCFRGVGMNIPSTPPVVYWCSRDPGRDPSYEKIEPEIAAALARFGNALPDLLFVVLPRRGVLQQCLLRNECMYTCSVGELNALILFCLNFLRVRHGLRT